ncbi:P-loop containing nucleoside triphosphate hydrolase protein [Lipomyces tetrasporus]|uniref:P-loop containing nucleoside triphosphate hydrolase protein n=1 Tax=Lipomyces tetrasporus TaxID=54092 RepID=A0AAD7QWK8_9ASCO|nr:P-loop containing nucleoside triphosphate hydrolase protein [Lipomyces tetrasporus]KAJ8102663.1 P-loop containing nucleoside triphosphate hydrolase protein [Lipomyces tetrasporus]
MDAMAKHNKPLVVFKNCILRPQYFSKEIFPSPTTLTLLPAQKWAITGTHKTRFLEAIAGQYTATPAESRSYPFLEKSVWPASVTSLVSFATDIKPAYLSARYESYREPEDVDLASFLKKSLGGEAGGISPEDQIQVYESVVDRLGLEPLLSQWIVTLSNGQMRRARLARGLLSSPKILLADEPFLGLDPVSTSTLSQLLGELAPAPHVILGLRAHERVPDWISHIAVVDESGLIKAGKKEDVAEKLQELLNRRNSIFIDRSYNFKASNLLPLRGQRADSIIDIDNITVAYKGKVVLKDLKWTVRRGERWHLRGNNGTGKSTLLSLITADHPQSWNSKIRLFGEPRKVGRQNYFSINKVIGHASPEIHAIFPATLTAFQTVSTGFTVGSFLPPSSVSHVAGDLTKQEQTDRIASLLQYFNVNPDTLFSELTLNDQKLALFMRAIVKNPEVLILDEAFSGMNDESIFRCKHFVHEWGGTVIAIGHLEDEIPRCDKYIRLHGGENSAEQGVVV